jgi:hypothetical protein
MPSQPTQSDTFPRRWYLRVCPCGTIGSAGVPCAGFPGAWNEDQGDFDRRACLGETVEVVEVGKETLDAITFAT